ncbi:hypothetical protein [Streptomyces sp. I05A-00742]|uniref:hypothetical protein n=1 Tax=Streptomyces sp. I05A-00742 TaxID=2732853 RepID=UPI001489D948|nr:hypothetical protein [Streptomyces sp. I05A-00742]
MIVRPRHRRLVPQLAALLCAAGALTACGTEGANGTTGTDGAAGTPGAAAASGAPGSSDAPGSSAPSASSSPAGGVPPHAEPGDGAPHHAENHAYRGTVPLTADQQRKGDAEAARVWTALERLRTAKTTEPRTVGPALRRLGYGKDAVTVNPNGNGTSYRLALPDLCMRGTVDALKVRVVIHGQYMEGGGNGCTEPRGGH